MIGLLLMNHAWAERLITYEEALRAAAASNPSLVSAKAQEEQADAGFLSARSIFDPQLNVNGLWRPNNKQQGFFQGFPFEQESRGWNASSGLSGSLGTGTSYTIDTSLDRNFSSFSSQFGAGIESEQIQDAYNANFAGSITQQLLKGHRFSYNVQNVTSARNALTVAEITTLQTAQQALGDAAAAYWNWAYQVRLAEIADESVVVAEEALRVGMLKVEAGELAPVEQTRLEAAQVQAYANALEARNQAASAADTLLLLMGEPPGSTALPATKLGEVRAQELDVASAVEVALAQNPELAIARANLEAAEQDLANAKHARLPTLSATLSSGVRAQHDAEEKGSNVIGGLADNAFPYWTVGSNLSVPLGNRAARGEQQRTESVVYQRSETVGQLERSIRSQVEAQVRTLSSSRRRLDLAAANLRLAEQTLTAEEALADAGDKVRNGRDVLEARNEVERTKTELAKAKTDYRLAQVELLRLQGQLTADLP